MNFCPKCRKELIVEGFCFECGADLSEYYIDNAKSLGRFDSSAMESEEQRQERRRNIIKGR